MQPSLEEEIQELEARLGSDSDPDGRAFAALADAYRRAGSLDRAVALLEDGLERHPTLTVAHLVAGRVHRARGEAERAERAYRRVVELDGEHGEALRALAEIAEDRGRNGEARELYHRLALAEPEDAGARDSLRRLKRQHFEELLGEPAPGPTSGADPFSTSPEGERPAIYTRTMAELYARQGLMERAIEIYERLLEETPDDEVVRERLEELRHGTGPPVSPVTGTEADDARTEEEVESLARDWAAGPDETGSLDSPFAWAEGEGPGPGEDRTSAGPGVPSAAAYFRRLLGGGDAGPAEEEPEPSQEPEASPEPNAEKDFRSWLDGLDP